MRVGDDKGRIESERPCVYLEEYIQLYLTNDNKMLTMLHFHIWSLDTNFINLDALLANFNQTPDIIAVTEIC